MQPPEVFAESYGNHIQYTLVVYMPTGDREWYWVSNCEDSPVRQRNAAYHAFQAAISELHSQGVTHYTAELQNLFQEVCNNNSGVSNNTKYSNPPKEFYKTFPCLKEKVWCPHGMMCQVYSNGEKDSLMNMIVHLNDHHQWLRKDIANWLDSLEIDLEAKEIEHENV